MRQNGRNCAFRGTDGTCERVCGTRKVCICQTKWKRERERAGRKRKRTQREGGERENRGVVNELNAVNTYMCLQFSVYYVMLTFFSRTWHWTNTFIDVMLNLPIRSKVMKVVEKRSSLQISVFCHEEGNRITVWYVVRFINRLSLQNCYSGFTGFRLLQYSNCPHTYNYKRLWKAEYNTLISYSFEFELYTHIALISFELKNK